MAMTLRERLLTTLRGGVSDRIPWNVYAWLLPNSGAAQRLCRKGLGLMGTRRIFREIHDGVTICEERKDEASQPHFRVVIETPAGTLTEEATIEPNYGSRRIRKYFISGVEDYPAAEFFFRHTRFEPDFEPWRQADAALGDGSIISPRLFERYCAPTYARAMPVMRSAGKIPIAHYDGSNRPLVRCLAQTDLPVIEAFTPPPMGNLSVAEAKAAWPDKVVWVSFPGSHFLMPAEAIEAYALDLLREGAPGGRLVIGCTEDFPASEFEKTFTAIGRALAKYEGYDW